MLSYAIVILVFGGALLLLVLVVTLCINHGTSGGNHTNHGEDTTWQHHQRVTTKAAVDMAQYNSSAVVLGPHIETAVNPGYHKFMSGKGGPRTPQPPSSSRSGTIPLSSSVTTHCVSPLLHGQPSHSCVMTSSNKPVVQQYGMGSKSFQPSLYHSSSTTSSRKQDSNIQSDQQVQLGHETGDIIVDPALQSAEGDLTYDYATLDRYIISGTKGMSVNSDPKYENITSPNGQGGVVLEDINSVAPLRRRDEFITYDYATNNQLSKQNDNTKKRNQHSLNKPRSSYNVDDKVGQTSVALDVLAEDTVMVFNDEEIYIDTDEIHSCTPQGQVDHQPHDTTSSSATVQIDGNCVEMEQFRIYKHKMSNSSGKAMYTLI